MKSFFLNFWLDIKYFFTQVSDLTVKDAVDIILVAAVIYTAIRFIRDRRAGKLILGVFFLALGKFFCDMVGFSTLGYLLRLVFENGLLVIAIVFQPELRSLLEMVGGEPWKGLNLKSLKMSIIKSEKEKELVAATELIDALCVAVCEMSKEKTGALIVIERETKIGEIAKSGVKIDAMPSARLIQNIFFKNSPMHDGALLVRNSRLHSAGCYLPLSTNPDININLGTRHRAAIGMSENSDALVIVVSEETGNISIASGGKITRNFDYTTLKNQLITLLLEPLRNKNSQKKPIFAKNKDAADN